MNDAVAAASDSRLMTLKEVAARLAVSPMTVHRMPLASIRLGRSLRFDPRDVERFIHDSKEQHTHTEAGPGVGASKV